MKADSVKSNYTDDGNKKKLRWCTSYWTVDIGPVIYFFYNHD